jgi:hypothetical protein
MPGAIDISIQFHGHRLRNKSALLNIFYNNNFIKIMSLQDLKLAL